MDEIERSITDLLAKVQETERTLSVLLPKFQKSKLNLEHASGKMQEHFPDDQLTLEIEYIARKNKAAIAALKDFQEAYARLPAINNQIYEKYVKPNEDTNV